MSCCVSEISPTHAQTSPLHAHPCTPLSSEEILAAVALIKKQSVHNATTRFVAVTLKEQSKVDVLRDAAMPLPRFAQVTLLDNRCLTSDMLCDSGSV